MTMTGSTVSHALGAQPSPSVAAALDHVTVRFARPGGGVTTALENVSLELKEGELLVLVGRSGSGKTTALNVLAGLAQPTDGVATVLGKRPVAARAHLGYMFARDALLPWRSAVRNIEFGLELRGVPKEVRRKRALEYLDMVQLKDYFGNFPSQLSQGQRQRVALARTWALSPRVLLMDEPFAALDAQTREALQAEFLRIWAIERRSIVFVTHDLNEAIAIGDRILVFANGRLAREFSVPFERPRDVFEIASHPEALAMFREIRELLAH
jgi:NitT/TauT family transport system ATP-binding protein